LAKKQTEKKHCEGDAKWTAFEKTEKGLLLLLLTKVTRRKRGERGEEGNIERGGMPLRA